MADIMRVDAPALHAAVPGFVALAASADDARRSLTSSIEAEGACWGRDETGTAFAESYVPAADQLRLALSGLVGAVRGVGESLALVASNADGSEERAHARLGGDGAL